MIKQLEQLKDKCHEFAFRTKDYYQFSMTLRKFTDTVEKHYPNLMSNSLSDLKESLNYEFDERDILNGTTDKETINKGFYRYTPFEKMEQVIKQIQNEYP